MVFGGPIECRNATAPPVLSFITATVSVLLMLITVPGNLLICVAVVRDPCKTLRTPFNLFLLNISAADLVVGLGVLPLSIAYHTLEGMGLYYSALVKTLHLVFFISCTASVLGIAALSLDRYICVSTPLKYRLRLTSSRVKKVSAAIWLISVACPFAYLYVDFIIYTFVFANGTILFTLVILLFVNHKISRSLQTQRTQLQILSADGEQMRTSLMQRDQRVTKTFLFFLYSFVILTTPALSFSYVLNFSSTCNCQTIHIIRDFQFVSILFPSSVNPFIYALRLPNFRKAIQRIVYSCKMALSVTKDPSVPPWASFSSESLNGQLNSRRVSYLPPFGLSVVNQFVISETNTKIDAVSTPNPRYSNLSPDVNHTGISDLDVDANFKLCEQTTKGEENGISHFYRVTTNL